MCLERKCGGQRPKILLQIDELENFKSIQNETSREIEKFADLSDIAVTNLKDAKREDEQSNETFIASYYVNYQREWWFNTIVGYSNTRKIKM